MCIKAISLLRDQDFAKASQPATQAPWGFDQRVGGGQSLAHSPRSWLHRTLHQLWCRRPVPDEAGEGTAGRSQETEVSALTVMPDFVRVLISSNLLMSVSVRQGDTLGSRCKRGSTGDHGPDQTRVLSGSTSFTVTGLASLLRLSRLCRDERACCHGFSDR